MDLIQTLVKHFHIAPGLQGRTELGKGRGKENLERAARRRIGKAGVI